MSCINVSVSKACRGINVLAALACVPLQASVLAGELLRVDVLAEKSKAQCSVGVAYTPMSAKVSRVCSLGEVTDDGYQVFRLSNGGRFLLKDGKIFRVIKEYE